MALTTKRPKKLLPLIRPAVASAGLNQKIKFYAGETGRSLFVSAWTNGMKTLAAYCLTGELAPGDVTSCKVKKRTAILSGRAGMLPSAHAGKTASTKNYPQSKQ